MQGMKMLVLVALLFGIVVADNDFVVLQRNLANARKIHVYRKDVYIAEAGVGAGNDFCVVTGSCCGYTEIGPTCYGLTSRISRVNKRGRNYEVLVDGVGSAAYQGAPIPGMAMAFAGGSLAVSGITSVVVIQNNLYYTTGILYEPPLSVNYDTGSLYRVDLTQCNPTCTSVKITTFGLQINSTHPYDISNPYHIIEDFTPGQALVVDAGANSLFRISLTTGNILQSVFFPGVEGGDAVPTSCAIGPDGYIYVSTLSGQHPPAVGYAKIYKVSADFSSVQVYLSNLTNVIDLKFDSDGNLWYLQYQDLAYFSGRYHDGTLFKYNARRNVSVPIQSFTTPTGFNFIGDNLVFVSDYGAYSFSQLVSVEL